MLFSTAVLANILLATAALAAPRGRLNERVARRREGRQSKPIQRIPTTVSEVTGSSNISHVEYSSNWAGAVLDSSAGTYKSVSGTFTVPTPKTPSGTLGLVEYSASAWVGIDGDTCETAILQTGVDFNIWLGAVTYDAWYEWYPDYAYDFSGISFSAGDEVKLTVTATSTKAGSAVIENLTTGKTVSKSITSSSALCQSNAEWIVEDFEEGSSLVPFANFGTVEFTSVSPSPLLATIIDIQQSGKTLTSASAGLSSVTVSYV